MARFGRVGHWDGDNGIGVRGKRGFPIRFCFKYDVVARIELASNRHIIVDRTIVTPDSSSTLTICQAVPKAEAEAYLTAL